MTGKEIVERARSFKHFKYWYGGKRQKATASLALVLAKQNPHIWNDTYYKKALEDVAAGARVCDCSGLVCSSYLITDIGSWEIKEHFKVWNGKPLPGMIAWRAGHVGIIIDDDGHMAEMRSQAHDYCETRTYKEAGMTHILYDETVKYSDIGWNKDGSGWWYRHTAGTGPNSYYHDGAAIIDGRVYLFNSNGYLYYAESGLPNITKG